jgi:hypothetical protein
MGLGALARFAELFSVLRLWAAIFFFCAAVARRFCEKDQKGEKDTGCSQPRAASADRKVLVNFYRLSSPIGPLGPIGALALTSR